MVDDYILDRDQHQKHHDADDEAATDNEPAERLNYLPCSAGAACAIQQDQARGGNI